jgi:hypothetical protein
VKEKEKKSCLSSKDPSYLNLMMVIKKEISYPVWIPVREKGRAVAVYFIEVV